MYINMTETFPLLYERSYDQSARFWSLRYMPNVSGFSAVVVSHFEEELASALPNVAPLLRIGSAFGKDLISQKKAYPLSKGILNYIQFVTCGSLLAYFSRNKYFTLCHDWILNSLADEISSDLERTFEPGRLMEFIANNRPFVLETRDQVIADWIHDLFYYSRHSGGNKEISEYCLSNLLPWFLWRAQVVKSLEFAMALSQISTWCYNFNYDDVNRAIQAAMLTIYNASDERTIKKLIALHFSCSQENDTGQSRLEWTEIVMSNYNDLLYPHEKFQVLANRWEDDIAGIRTHFEEIIAAINQYKDGEKPFHGVLFNHIKSTFFTILNRMEATLLLNAQVDLTNRLYGAYFGIDDQHLIPPQNIYIVPGLEEGTLFVSQGQKMQSSGDGNNMLSVILRLHNAFLGTSFTTNDDMSFIPEMAERPGVPDRKSADVYERALQQLLHLHDVWMLKEKTFNGYHLVLGMQLPIQNVLSFYLGNSIPLIHSFQNPLPARKIRKVFVWQGFTQMAETERLGLEEIFKKSTIELTVCHCFESTKEDFVRHYVSPDYDLVWIVGHGEFQHQSAHVAYLDLGNEIRISIDELISIELTHVDRRLLVIDACDGATTSLFNSPAAIGIAAAVVGKSQSVMSHNWPVEDVSSLIFGLLIASYLSTGHEYSKTHYQAVSTFREGKGAVLDRLEGSIQNEDVLDRIRNRDIEHQNFYYWGSLAYII